jgi:hypothetical protein
MGSKVVEVNESEKRERAPWSSVKALAMYGFGGIWNLDLGKDLDPNPVAQVLGLTLEAPTEAHLKAAKAYVAGKNFTDPDRIVKSGAKWLAFQDQLVLAGIGPHETDRKDEPTGIKTANSYSANTRHSVMDPRTRAIRFLEALGYPTVGVTLPAPAAPSTRTGGNVFAKTAAEALAPAVAPVVDVAPVVQTVGADAKLQSIASAMRAAGCSPVDIAMALAAVA